MLPRYNHLALDVREVEVGGEAFVVRIQSFRESKGDWSEPAVSIQF